MKKKNKIGFLVLVILAIIVSCGVYLHHTNVEVLNPKGPIALKERNLMFLVFGLSLFVVIPVYTATIMFAIRYREGNKKKHHYSPNWDHSRIVETIWWLSPTILIGILSVITWQSTHALAPNKPLVSSKPTMVVQVVALDWRWLFIYPKENVATLNYVNIPVGTPVDFQITADAPMNSFWIPQLGGQIYAMAGMTTNLNLMASVTGNFRGSSANISGVGFSGMNFITHSTTESSFDNWLAVTHREHNDLSLSAYNMLSQPSQSHADVAYSSVSPELFDSILMKYMTPVNQSSPSSNGAMTGMVGMTGTDMQ
jgi:cytochrome o ubiquinol oxidase subunit 2